MKSISIGIHVYEEPQRLLATLSSLKSNTDRPYELVLLVDGPDTPTRDLIDRLEDTRKSSTLGPNGAPVCFNRLIAETDSELVVFLESGALVGPRWLDHILLALEADSRNGLAGPSTNRSWNEQRILRESGDSAAEIERNAANAALRFGGEVRSLEPLYSLADFCYAVRREVIESVGSADERYGLGPCWEMDYNVRAARARWKGVWACASYVHRAPFGARRRIEESRRFETNRKLYQDKFCGARLRGETTGYRTHCRGDACANFAPPALIEIQQMSHASAPALSPAQSVTLDSPRSDTLPPASQVLVADEALVTCIMPTCDRRLFVPQAARCALRQDYKRIELLVVDDGADPIADCLPDDPRIRYIRLSQKLSVGAKRNLACQQARGTFIVHWDDDDWYPSWRVTEQIKTLAQTGADLCGSSRVLYFDANADKAWEYQYRGGTQWVAGNTFAYRKEFWERNRFPDMQVGEDSRFLWSNVQKRIHDLVNPSLCVASVHAANTSHKETGGTFWRPIPAGQVHQTLGDDRYFYRTGVSSWPLVSCIMPTFNRRRFVPLALKYFAQQDYPNRELIVVDDGDDPVGDLVSGLERVRYVRLPSRASIGTKRNRACQAARGQIIAHWDDDDWYSPDRLRYQVMPILAGHADITGLESHFVLDLSQGEFWTANQELHRRLFVGDVHGGTLVYRRDHLNETLRYPDISLAEDAWLLHRMVQSGRRLVRLSNPGVFVYIRHGKNAWRDFSPGHFLNPQGWARLSSPAFFSQTRLDSYRAAAPEDSSCGAHVVPRG